MSSIYILNNGNRRNKLLITRAIRINRSRRVSLISRVVVVVVIVVVFARRAILSHESESDRARSISFPKNDQFQSPSPDLPFLDAWTLLVALVALFIACVRVHFFSTVIPTRGPSLLRFVARNERKRIYLRDRGGATVSFRFSSSRDDRSGTKLVLVRRRWTS